MKKFIPFISIIFGLTFLSSCKNSPKDQGGSSGPPEAVLNMGGLNTPRGLINDSGESTPGYIFFNPLLSHITYMINLKGEVVHTWESEYGPSGWVYLRENGNLARGGRMPNAPVFDGGGQGGVLQEFSWNGDLLWEYSFATSEHQTHHDVALMPNGNYLAIAWESKTPEEALQAGRKPEMIPKAGLWPDMIVELMPKGPNNAIIVWEWHIWDHLVQDYDATLDNYGDPSAHPELLNINLGGPLPKPVTQEELDKRRARNNSNTNDTPDNQGSDLYHMNAIDYNVKLDQIVLSSPHLDEIYIIDHSTTSEEAAGHSGGKWGKGGDFLYRWGNPENYSRGDTTDRVLGGQHDVTWVPEGRPGAGNLLLFNNSVPYADKPHSIILELETPITESGYSIKDDNTFGPDKPKWSYIAEDTVSFNAPFISGVHRMENGHTFITQGPMGRYFEVTEEGEVLWDYLTPYSGNARMPDGTFPQPVGPLIFATFRATHIPLDHSAVAGKTLTPLSPQPEVHKVSRK